MDSDLINSVSIVSGLGQHGQEITDILAKEKLLKQGIRLYPKLSVIDFQNGVPVSEYGSGAFEIMQRVLWAGARRLPFGRSPHAPMAVTFPLADKLISKRLKPCKLFIAWSQCSLFSMRRARELGAMVLLEYPTSDINTWNELVKYEYETWGNGSLFHGIFPNKIVERMREECGEADRINALSNFTKRSLIRGGIQEDKIDVTPLGVDASLLIPNTRKSINAKLRIIYVGRLELLKGLQYLLDAFSRIKTRNIELVLVGRRLPEIEGVLKRFRDDRITFLGEVPRSQLPEIYREADISVFPTVNDSFGMVVLEAMASGLPVITTENSCGADVVSDGVDGFVIPIRDPETIKERIEYFLDNRERVEEMGAAARKSAITNFSREQYQARFLNLCMSLSGGI